MATQAAALGRAAQVVEHAERHPAEAGDGERMDENTDSFGIMPACHRRASGQPGGDRGGDDLPGDRPGGHRGAFEERDGLTAVIGPGPGLLPGRRVPPERGVGGPRGDGRDDPGARYHGQAEASGALHFVFTVFVTFPVAFVVGVAGAVGVTLGTAGLTSEAPETP